MTTAVAPVTRRRAPARRRLIAALTACLALTLPAVPSAGAAAPGPGQPLPLLAETTPGNGQAHPRSAVGAAAAIASLNAQRAANGIPAGIEENTTWSHGCALHVRYAALNGPGPNPHDEDPALPGYTPLGQQAARSSVLGGTFTPDGANPYEYAPLHLMQLLGPGLSVTGYAPGCMWTWPGYQRPAPDLVQTYSYPGPGATIYPSMVAAEWPFVPGDFVGLTGHTGPHLYLFVFGRNVRTVRIDAAQLVGPTGAVGVRHVDNHTSGPRGDLGAYLPPGGIVIPADPLRNDAVYHASAQGSYQVWDDTLGGLRDVAVTWSWDFRTQPAPTIDTGPAQQATPRGRITIRATVTGRVARFDVDPDRVRGGYLLTLQRQRSGRWRDVITVGTHGRRDAVGFRLTPGLYRAVAPAQHGLTAGRSRPVRVRR